MNPSIELPIPGMRDTQVEIGGLPGISGEKTRLVMEYGEFTAETDGQMTLQFKNQYAAPPLVTVYGIARQGYPKITLPEEKSASWNPVYLQELNEIVGIEQLKVKFDAFPKIDEITGFTKYKDGFTEVPRIPKFSKTFWKDLGYKIGDRSWREVFGNHWTAGKGEYESVLKTIGSWIDGMWNKDFIDKINTSIEQINRNIVYLFEAAEDLSKMTNVKANQVSGRINTAMDKFQYELGNNIEGKFNKLIKKADNQLRKLGFNDGQLNNTVELVVEGVNESMGDTVESINVANERTVEAVKQLIGVGDKHTVGLPADHYPTIPGIAEIKPTHIKLVVKKGEKYIYNAMGMTTV